MNRLWSIHADADAESELTEEVRPLHIDQNPVRLNEVHDASALSRPSRLAYADFAVKILPRQQRLSAVPHKFHLILFRAEEIHSSAERQWIHARML